MESHWEQPESDLRDDPECDVEKVTTDKLRSIDDLTIQRVRYDQLWGIMHFREVRYSKAQCHC
jgi:hypothetical protein